MGNSNAGRNRLPDQVKKDRGTFKPSRSSGDEIRDVMVLDAGDPALPLSDIGMEMWHTITKTMITYKTLSEVDIYSISMLCIEWETYMECMGKGIVDVAPDGTLKPSAYYIIRQKSIKTISDLAKDLGISTLIRMKIRQPEDEKPKDPAAKFF